VLAGLVLIHGLDKVVRLRVSDEDEVKGLDETYWDVPPAGTDPAAGPAVRVGGK
jgi:hypothetical protein